MYISGALKLFLRELESPLLPWEKLDDFGKAIKIQDPKEKLKQLKKLLKALPIANYQTLNHLLLHLIRG